MALAGSFFFRVLLVKLSWWLLSLFMLVVVVVEKPFPTAPRFGCEETIWNHSRKHSMVLYKAVPYRVLFSDQRRRPSLVVRHEPYPMHHPELLHVADAAKNRQIAFFFVIFLPPPPYVPWRVKPLSQFPAAASLILWSYRLGGSPTPYTTWKKCASLIPSSLFPNKLKLLATSMPH